MRRELSYTKKGHHEPPFNPEECNKFILLNGETHDL